jgi:hypothetical protein
MSTGLDDSGFSGDGEVYDLTAFASPETIHDRDDIPAVPKKMLLRKIASANSRAAKRARVLPTADGAGAASDATMMLLDDNDEIVEITVRRYACVLTQGRALRVVCACVCVCV